MKPALVLLAFLIGILPGGSAAAQNPPDSDPAIRYFSHPGNPIFLKMPDTGVFPGEMPSPEAPPRAHLETRYFSVTLPPSADTPRLAWQISDSVKWWKKFDLAEELDNLYQKVLQTTGLYKSAPDKIKIDFRENFHSPGRGAGSSLPPPAAYYPEARTIYVISQKATREIMAHEMAHAALHRYTGIRLPRNVDEAAAIWTAEQLR